MTPAERVAGEKKVRTGKSAGANRKVKWVCKVLERREALGLSQRDVCAAIGINFGGLTYIERGSDLNLATARKIADFFGATVEELWPKLLEAPERPLSPRSSDERPPGRGNPRPRKKT